MRQMKSINKNTNENACSDLYRRCDLFWKLHIQTLLARVQTVDHLLVLQFSCADHQASQITPEVLSHVTGAS